MCILLLPGQYAGKSRWLGSRLTEALKLVLLIGTSEAFLHAVATENQLKRSNDSLLVFSLIYVILNILLIRSAGAVGLILANSISILFLSVFLTSNSFIKSLSYQMHGSPTGSYD
uniref:Protein RFT1 homolog n=1 Tax=Rhizophora mucronata TaxID=61149 RepID=A0A2P2LI78_RHIMU